MENFIATLQHKFNSGLLELADGQLNKLQQIKSGYDLACSVIDELKDFHAGYTFKNQLEEINFFKEQLPFFLKEQIFYAELFQLESNKPIGSIDTIKPYYSFQLKIWQQFIERHISFFNYYRLGNTVFDVQYFAKSNDQTEAFPDTYLMSVCSNATPHSYLLSMLLAYEKLCHYANKQMVTIENNCSPVSNDPSHSKSNINWTDSKVSLIELAYALQAKGSINFGSIDIKQIVAGLEELFNVKLGNFYRVYMDMLIRKKAKTPYLDSLKEYLERRMDEAD